MSNNDFLKSKDFNFECRGCAASSGKIIPMVALFDSRNISDNEVQVCINNLVVEESPFSNPNVVFMTKAQFSSVFSSLLGEVTEQEEDETSPNRPRVGETVWGVVKDYKTFGLTVVEAEVESVDNRVFRFVKKSELRMASQSCYTTAREEWLKSVFPDKERAEKARDRIIQEQRFNP